MAAGGVSAGAGGVSAGVCMRARFCFRVGPRALVPSPSLGTGDRAGLVFGLRLF